MYKVCVEDHFDAAHYLRDYGGKCENLHGHRFKVAVNVKASTLDEIGLAFDFTRLKSYLEEVLTSFDHTCLNEVTPFDKINPSSENIARIIYERLEAMLPGEKVVLDGVEVWESPGSRVLYHP